MDELILLEEGELLSDPGNIAIDEATKSVEAEVSAVIHAIKSGEALVQKKAELKHGEFLPWIKENMPVKKDQCYRYIKAYEYVSKNSLASEISPDTSIRQICQMADDEKNKDAREKAAKKRQKRAELNKASDQLREDKPELFEKPDTRTHQERVQDLETDLEYIEKLQDILNSFAKLNQTDMLTSIIKEFDNKDMNKAIFRVMKQYMHPDKDSGNKELFQKLLIVEEKINE